MAERNDAEIKKERRKEQKREVIFEAALNLFAEKGFHPTKVEEIAEAAGIGKGTLYEYFSGKENLLVELIFHYSYNRMEENKRTVAGLTDPVEKIESLIRANVRMAASMGDILFRIVPKDFMKNIKGDGVLLGRFIALRQEYGKLIESILEEGCRQGVFRSLDVRVNSVIIAGLIEALGHANSHEKLLDFPAAEDEVVEFVFAALGAGQAGSKCKAVTER